MYQQKLYLSMLLRLSVYLMYVQCMSFQELQSVRSGAVDIRELKALELAARAKIVWGGESWSVPSQSGNQPYRVVTWPGAESCACEDFQLRQAPCKHVIAARLVEEREGKKKAPAIDTDTAPERKTYTQNWPLYNLAQSVE